MIRQVIFLILAFILIESTYGEVIINEVMSNEPSSERSLEWVELYNNNETSIDLLNYRINLNGTDYIFDSSIVLGSNDYFIIARNLYTSDGKPGFYERWGFDSEIWENVYPETNFNKAIQIDFSLTNNNGLILLHKNNGILISTFEWIESGQDGCSWERLDPSSDSILQSIDKAGSTPGFINSQTELSYDLAIIGAEITTRSEIPEISIQITNRGREIVKYAKLNLYQTDSANNITDTLAFIALPDINPSDTEFVDGIIDVDGKYIYLKAILSDDDRIRNNFENIVTVGDDFPEIIISELLANPLNELMAEWVEIYNNSMVNINLKNWFIADAVTTVDITDDDLILESGEYLILTSDSIDFNHFYNLSNLQVHQINNFPNYNNSSDVVMLLEMNGIVIDKMEYSEVFDSNYTWSYNYNIWGRSTLAGGTPGVENTITYLHEYSENIIEINPTHISPDGDGFEDFTVISINVVNADNYSAKIFNKQGNPVITFFQDVQFIPEEIIWDGKSQTGDRLPLGIYIFLFEIQGQKSIKKPIVIAR